jgi:hypothetical protein
MRIFLTVCAKAWALLNVPEIPLIGSDYLAAGAVGHQGLAVDFDISDQRKLDKSVGRHLVFTGQLGLPVDSDTEDVRRAEGGVRGVGIVGFFSEEELGRMLRSARRGIRAIVEEQKRRLRWR